jgi:hypothetical protein
MSRSPRKPTLLSIAKQAEKAGLNIERVEIEPTGKIVIITSRGDSADVKPNPWDAETAKLLRATPKGRGE